MDEKHSKNHLHLNHVPDTSQEMNLKYCPYRLPQIKVHIYLIDF